MWWKSIKKSIQIEKNRIKRFNRQKSLKQTTNFSSAQLCSRYKPSVPIIAVTRYARVARQLHLFRGVFPLFYEPERDPDWPTDMDSRVSRAMAVGMEVVFFCRPIFG
jgi:pyruvate kinase